MDKRITTQMLKSFTLFEDLAEDDLKTILGFTRLFKSQRDQILLLDGEASDCLYFVLEGWFKAEKTSPEGRQQTLRFIGPKETINELSVFSNKISAVTVIAMEDARGFCISREDVEKMLIRYPQFSRAVIRNLANRIQHLLSHVENLSLYPVDVRLARLLLDEAEEDVMTRPVWKTQTEIANQLGTVLDVVNRNLQKLVQEGVIEMNRGEIKIIDRSALEKLAEI